MAEAVGIALAIAPLIISAIENYGKTAKGFKAFQNYSKHVKAHIQTLNIQGVIFRKANERFLGQCVGEDQARLMLQNRTHSSWEDLEAATLIVEKLSDSRVAFEDSIELIVGALVIMRTTLNEFDVSGSDEKSIKKRIKYAFKQSNIEAALKDLTRKTRDFVTLVDLLNGNQQQASRHNVTAISKRYIARLASVQTTAQDLYNALGQACTKHTDHQAHLSLQPVQTDLSQIKFTIAFSHLSLKESSNLPHQCQNSVWLTVESQVTGRIKPISNDNLLTTAPQHSLKRVIDSTDASVYADNQIKKPQKKTVRIQEVLDDGRKLNCDQRLELAPLTNLCASNNFCNHLQKFAAHSQPRTVAIGYLELSGCSKHLLYIDSRSQVVKQTADVFRLSSLYHILKRTREDRTGEGTMSLPHRILIARQLATAVLQFHSTPWLRRSWNSREVLVALPSPCSNDDNQIVEKTQAYVSAAIHSNKELLAYPQTNPSAAIIRNMLLFRLGVMLLEIAFESPLADLIQQRDRLKATDGNVEYFTADRLCRQVSAHMGFKYAEVTRKCIHCDFGCDFDLDKSKLQEGFHQDVICELEKLEKRLQEI